MFIYLFIFDVVMKQFLTFYFTTRVCTLIQNEKVADHDKRLKYLSGFSGTGGLAVVTQTSAAFWTGWMYHQQADEELSCDWQLFLHEESVSVDREFWFPFSAHTHNLVYKKVYKVYNKQHMRIICLSLAALLNRKNNTDG